MTKIGRPLVVAVDAHVHKSLIDLLCETTLVVSVAACLSPLLYEPLGFSFIENRDVTWRLEKFKRFLSKWENRQRTVITGLARSRRDWKPAEGAHRYLSRTSMPKPTGNKNTWPLDIGGAPRRRRSPKSFGVFHVQIGISDQLTNRR